MRRHHENRSDTYISELGNSVFCEVACFCRVSSRSHCASVCYTKPYGNDVVVLTGRILDM